MIWCYRPVKDRSQISHAGDGIVTNVLPGAIGEFCDVSTALAVAKVAVFVHCAAGRKSRWVSTGRGERFTEEV